MEMDFDELNELNQILQQRHSEQNEFKYDEYFGIMDISEEEKKKRIKLAEQFEILFLFFFLKYLEDKSSDYTKMIYKKYEEIALEFLDMKKTPSYVQKHAKDLADEIVKVTKEHDGEDFYTSRNRGMLISANEANAIGNYSQHLKAIKNGKRYKTWITEKDSRVRHTHKAVDEKKIEIFEPFQVGDSLMMFPKDMETYGAELKEIAGCRCVIKYS